jgi:hypothetical protein
MERSASQPMEQSSGGATTVAPVAPGISRPVSVKTASSQRAVFQVVWYTCNLLLIFAFLLAAYSVLWEYSTREYLRGFSDAVVPASSSTQDKIEAILQWMAHGPARMQNGPTGQDRDPTDTLNYDSLLKVCGSATNAFINLADSAGLSARRLLLLNSQRLTNHVVAEVLVDGRWIIVDPAFRAILKAKDGRLLTQKELADPMVFAEATRNISGYDPQYTFDHTAHVRVSRIHLIGLPIRTVLDHIMPGWQDSPTISLLLERESLAIMVIALILVFLLGLLRVGLRWYGESRLGVRPIRIRQQVRRALHAFVHTAS